VYVTSKRRQHRAQTALATQSEDRGGVPTSRPLQIAEYCCGSAGCVSWMVVLRSDHVDLGGASRGGWLAAVLSVPRLWQSFAGIRPALSAAWPPPADEWVSSLSLDSG